MRRAFTSISTTKWALASLGLVSILLLGSGCAMANDTGSSQGGDGNAGSEGSGGEGTSEIGDEAGDDSANSPLAAAQACFPGAWTLDVESYMQSVAETEQIQNASGVVTVTFAEDGSVTTTYDDWGYDIIVNISTTTSVRNGTDTGTYEIAADGTAKITDVSIESEDKTTMTMGATSQTVTENPGGSMFRTVPLSCEGDEITASVLDDRTATLNRA